MAVKIRMKRLGAKKKPFYRIVVADVRSPRDGRFIEELGYYNPVATPKVFKVDEEKLADWIKKGAKPTDTVAKLLKTFGVVETKEVKKVEKNIELKKAKEAKKAAIEKKIADAKAAKEAEEARLKAEEEARAQAEAEENSTEETAE